MANNKRPDITGNIQVEEDGEYKTVAKVALWKQDKVQGKQPTHKGTITRLMADQKTPNGEKEKIALWIN